VYCRRVIGLVILVTLLAVGSLSAVAAKTTAASNPAAAIAYARQLLSSFSGGVVTSRYAEVGREYGQAVDGVRDGKATIEQLTTMREITRKLRERTDAHLRALEAAAGEDEAALETLYRSMAWDDLSFALAAFPYWGAWIDLEMHKKVKDAAAKKKWIWEAKKGFRGTSVQVFRPSLVYGGWLGLGYIAVAEDDNDRALKIFENLQEALGGDSSHPLLEVVSLQLRVLRAKTGNVIGPAPGGKIDAQESQLLRAEVFALFEYARETKSRAHNKRENKDAARNAVAAARRLRSLVKAGYIDNQLLGLVLEYHDEIYGNDIGLLTPLVGAEHAFAYGHDRSAANQYEKFFSNVKGRKDLSLDHIRFRYALASLKVKSYNTAAGTAERLLRNKKLDPRIKKAATKLAYVARVSRTGTHTESSRNALRKAAERLLRAYPSDDDADGARLTVAQTTTDSKKAYAMMNAVKAPSKLKGPMQQTRFFIVARDFSNAIRRTDAKPPTALAKKGIAAYKQLPSKQQKIPENFAIMLQMRALSDSDPQAVIAAIDAAEKSGSLGKSAQRGILWARLKSLERIGDHAALIDFLTRLANAGLEAWQLEQIYPSISAAADASVRLSAAQVLLPGTASDVAMERRFRIIVIEAMFELEQFSDAYEQAKSFRKAYPKVGDGYRLFALAAAKTDRPVEADRAWRTLTDRADPRRDSWWEGMLHRVQIRADSTRPKTACEVLFELDSRSEFMPAAIKPKLEALRGTLPCPAAQTG
jgi:hypothetical protein